MENLTYWSYARHCLKTKQYQSGLLDFDYHSVGKTYTASDVPDQDILLLYLEVPSSRDWIFQLSSAFIVTFCLNAFLAIIFKNSKKKLLMCEIRPVRLRHCSELVFTIDGLQPPITEWPKLASWVEAPKQMGLFADIDFNFCPWFYVEHSWLSIAFQDYVFVEIDKTVIGELSNSFIEIKANGEEWEEWQISVNSAIELTRSDFSIFYAIPWLVDRDSSKSTKGVTKYCRKLYKWYRSKPLNGRTLPPAITNFSLRCYHARIINCPLLDFRNSYHLWFFGAEGLDEPYLSQWLGA